MEELLNQKEIAEKLGISVPKMREIERSGRIPFYEVGEVKKFKLSEVLEALKVEGKKE